VDALISNQPGLAVRVRDAWMSEKGSGLKAQGSWPQYTTL
jgi:hypothetical protein